MGLLRRRKKREEEPEESGFSSEEPPAPAQRSVLGPADVEQKVFRLAFRGYNERDVDEFLDQVTNDLTTLHEENRRLREAPKPAVVSPGELDEAKRRAEETLREAREEASRIVEEAERRARLAAATEISAEVPPTSYLVREREFLTRLAALLQDHASFLRAEAGKAAAAGRTPEEPEATAPMPPVEGEEPPDEPPSPFAPPAEERTPGPAPAPAPPAPGERPAGTAPPRRPGEDAAPAPGAGPAGETEEEPTLRELFWGDE